MILEILLFIGKAIWFVIKWIGIGLWYLLKYTFPLLLCVILGLGAFVGSGVVFGKKVSNKWDNYVSNNMQHTVTIYWDESRSDFTTVAVREDLEWNLVDGVAQEYTKAGFRYNDRIMGAQMSDYHNAPSQMRREGYKFLGLFDTPFGGEQYVNAAGYALRTITRDIELYANWQEV